MLLPRRGTAEAAARGRRTAHRRRPPARFSPGRSSSPLAASPARCPVWPDRAAGLPSRRPRVPASWMPCLPPGAPVEHHAISPTSPRTYVPLGGPSPGYRPDCCKNMLYWLGGKVTHIPRVSERVDPLAEVRSSDVFSPRCNGHGFTCAETWLPAASSGLWYNSESGSTAMARLSASAS